MQVFAIKEDNMHPEKSKAAVVDTSFSLTSADIVDIASEQLCV